MLVSRLRLISVLAGLGDEAGELLGGFLAAIGSAVALDALGPVPPR